MRLGVEIVRMVKNLKADYKSGNGAPKKDKIKCYLRTIKMAFMYIWSVISAPLIYPIWYVFRKQIVAACYKGTSWEEVNGLINANEIAAAKKLVISNGRFLYWLWTYGDLRDPLGRGEIPDKKTNTFWNRYWESGFRNCRWIINMVEFRSATIVEDIMVIDKRDYTLMHRSEGLGDSPDGVYFRWFKDVDGKWCFCYEDNNVKNIFYYGYVGIHKKDIIGLNGRFEIGYRKTDSSYEILTNI